ncbi:MAG: hypothetical protein AAFV88_13345, partial [Planctomycetota bacterium]
MELTQKILDIVLAIVAIFGGSITAFLGISRFGKSIAQRAEEHRWKQAKLGKEIMDSIYEVHKY